MSAPGRLQPARSGQSIEEAALQLHQFKRPEVDPIRVELDALRDALARSDELAALIGAV